MSYSTQPTFWHSQAAAQRLAAIWAECDAGTRTRPVELYMHGDSTAMSVYALDFLSYRLAQRFGRLAATPWRNATFDVGAHGYLWDWDRSTTYATRATTGMPIITADGAACQVPAGKWQNACGILAGEVLGTAISDTNPTSLSLGSPSTFQAWSHRQAWITRAGIAIEVEAVCGPDAAEIVIMHKPRAWIYGYSESTTTTAEITTEMGLATGPVGEVRRQTITLPAITADKIHLVGFKSADPVKKAPLLAWRWRNADCNGVCVSHLACGGYYSDTWFGSVDAPLTKHGACDDMLAQTQADIVVVMLGSNDYWAGGVRRSTATYRARMIEHFDRFQAAFTAAGQTAPILVFVAQGYRAPNGEADWAAVAALYDEQADVCRELAERYGGVFANGRLLGHRCGLNSEEDVYGVTTPSEWAVGQTYVIGNWVQSNNGIWYQCIANKGSASAAGDRPGQSAGSLYYWRAARVFLSDAVHYTVLGQSFFADVIYRAVAELPPGVISAVQLATDQTGAPAANRLSSTTIGGVVGTYGAGAGTLTVSQVFETKSDGVLTDANPLPTLGTVSPTGPTATLTKAAGLLGTYTVSLTNCVAGITYSVPVTAYIPGQPAALVLTLVMVTPDVPQAEAGQTTAYCYCYKPDGSPDAGVTITTRCVSTTSANAYSDLPIVATSGSDGLASWFVPRNELLGFVSTRGKGEPVNWQGVDAASKNLSELLG